MSRIVDIEQLGCLIWKDGEHGTTFDDGVLWVLEKIDELPAAQPERPKGKWIVSHVPDSMLWECNQCGFDCGAHSFNFCPMCGAKMEGSE